MALLVTGIEYFLYDKFSERGAVGFGWLAFFLPVIFFFFVVKEARDKKLRGQIGFWVGFFLSLSTGVVIALINTGWYFLMYPVPEDIPAELFYFSMIGFQMMKFVPFSRVLALLLRRKA